MNNQIAAEKLITAIHAIAYVVGFADNSEEAKKAIAKWYNESEDAVPPGSMEAFKDVVNLIN